MIEQVVHPYTLQKALRQVIVNKGSAGIDGKKTTELADYFRKHKTSIIQALRNDNYTTQAILGVEIPKGEVAKLLKTEVPFRKNGYEGR